ncbi:exonuclease domain-containing protein [Corynebacterium kozikiae]|uniref:exonuclease domain-containing protein n=1 Tax=Corynebacterium kozikiae TaxID=2968469 RepID=UPI00211BD195|nr:exonuclease domain-containing protein [Corynebacterium sp. 76QC2CO]
MTEARIEAFRGTIEVDPRTLRFSPSTLAAALGHQAFSTPISSITSATISSLATRTTGGVVVLELADDASARSHSMLFAPNQAQAQQDLVDAVAAARRGELPVIATRAVAGLDFVAVDVETANGDWGSICQIGATLVRDGDVLETVAWLCQPPAPIANFDAENVAIHGITAEDVQDAMPYATAQEKLVDFIGDLPVVAHNAQFDMTALFRAAEAAGIAVPTLDFSCSLALSRHADLKVESHRLPVVAQYFGVDLTKHHDAGADAEACAGIIIGLAQRVIEQKTLSTPVSLRELTEHFGMTLGNLDAKRVYPVLAKLSSQRSATPTPATSATSASQAPAQARARARWAKAATPEVIPEPNLDADPTGVLFGQNVTLSGDFAPFEKGELWNALAARGAQVGKNVTKKTTILASGPWETKTSKLKRAEELIAKGQQIEIWSAEQLFEHLELSPE